MASKSKQQNSEEPNDGGEFKLPPKPEKLPPKDGRSHKATYAKDKKKGGYLVRVIGPQAINFAGRWVPVTRMDESENFEFLMSLIWSGVDEGTETQKGTGKPVALYSIYKQPKDEQTDSIPF